MLLGFTFQVRVHLVQHYFFVQILCFFYFAKCMQEDCALSNPILMGVQKKLIITVDLGPLSI
jgi:hypothetical protein